MVMASGRHGQRRCQRVWDSLGRRGDGRRRNVGGGSNVVRCGHGQRADERFALAHGGAVKGVEEATFGSNDAVKEHSLRHSVVDGAEGSGGGDVRWRRRGGPGGHDAAAVRASLVEQASEAGQWRKGPAKHVVVWSNLGQVVGGVRLPLFDEFRTRSSALETKVGDRVGVDAAGRQQHEDQAKGGGRSCAEWKRSGPGGGRGTVDKGQLVGRRVKPPQGAKGRPATTGCLGCDSNAQASGVHQRVGRKSMCQCTGERQPRNGKKHPTCRMGESEWV
mmetsp:Transcript_13078/g.41247  ORF Transcript_13078/g.41247 Transcript_13078/m.41247 type:complete len:276 (-) Transcript_13078:308-1135(-)